MRSCLTEMKLIVCLDQKDGMSFNRRRQSSDRLLLQRMLELVGENRLWMNAYSAKLFEELPENITVDEDFLSKAGAGDWCFAENVSLLPAAGKIEELTVYRWYKVYPADRKYPFPKGERVGDFWFMGSSHPFIVEEVYLP